MEKRPASTSGHKLLSRPPPLVPFSSSWPGNLQGPGICRFLLYFKSVKHLLLSLRVESVICLQKEFYVMGVRYLKVFYANLMQKLGKFQLWARASCITASWHLGRERVSVSRFRLVCTFNLKEAHLFLLNWGVAWPCN